MSVISSSIWPKLYLVSKGRAKVQYLLSIHEFIYTEGKPMKVHIHSTELNLINPLNLTNSMFKCLKLCLSHKRNVLAIAINAATMYHCQVILVTLSTNYGK